MGDQRLVPAVGALYAAAAAGPATGGQILRPSELQSQETRIYWQFRKCAKIHSIEGETESELWKGLQSFFRTKMRIPTSELAETDVVSVRKMRMGRTRGRQPHGEVVVVFADVEARDRVCSYARNLAPYIDDQNRPTAGVQMYVPAHLGGVQKILLCLLYTSPSPRDLSTSRMPSSA